jgi:predicted dehydrogenase
MKFLIIGLGSMGKRRIRNLKSLNAEKIIGFDLREERRKEVEKNYGIKTIKNLKDFDFNNVDAIIISTPPDKHNQYIKLAINKRKPAFVEASVILEGLEELNKLAKKKKVLIAPSCTLRFHPAIKIIENIVKSKKYGKVTNFSYHSGQYLPDWHPWEKVTNFYVGKKETGGAREIVPFELSWIVDIIGFPKKIIGFYGKTIDVGADIDDTYAISMDFGDVFGNTIVDVVSRYATRSLILNVERGQILWRWDEDFIKLYDASTKKWENYYFKKGQAAEGYNKDIMEDIYIEEMKTFIDAVEGSVKFPNSLDDDIKVLKLLNKIEGKL